VSHQVATLEINVLQLRLFGEPVVEHGPREANVPADAVAR
jgi:hypothetical protein